MLKEAIEFLLNKGAETKPYREKVHGVEFSDRALQIIKPAQPQPLMFQRLQGFADFVLQDRDDIDKEMALIHVTSPFGVHYYSTLEQEYRDREHYAKAQHDTERAFKFGSFMSVGDFVIALHTMFVNNNERARLLELVSNVKAVSERSAGDDGISQEFEMKAGVTLAKRGVSGNPFMLAPHRTFAEVTQPESPFILRAKQGGEDQPPSFALFECDNGAWQIDAIENIRAWLDGKLKETGIPILA